MRSNIVVSTEGDAGPYIIAPVSQISAIQDLLRTNEIPYWIDDDVISLDGRPAVGIFNLGRSSDPLKVQALLDAIP